jgi:hypothetical protein
MSPANSLNRVAYLEPQHQAFKSIDIAAWAVVWLAVAHVILSYFILVAVVLTSRVFW